MKIIFTMMTLLAAFSGVCQNSMPTLPAARPGSFAYDLAFLSHKDKVVVLSTADGKGKVIISPKYQGKVFTSTAGGDTGKSYGWINYSAFGKADPHMNAFGGEDRLWLGPEGGRFALFFAPRAKMDFANWHTPAAFDHESWELKEHNSSEARLTKVMSLVNYSGTPLEIRIERRISVMGPKQILAALAIRATDKVRMVGIRTVNTLINTGNSAWTRTLGAPCLWNLDMFRPSAKAVIILPYRDGIPGKVATTDYFGPIPASRLRISQGHVRFKADGKSRGKLGVPAARSTGIAGSYDPEIGVLTLITFDEDAGAQYLNQQWKTDVDPFDGDAVNAYNDGPLAGAKQMGPFYELESVSPAAFLKPGERLQHLHSVFHFSGDRNSLNGIALQTLGLTLSEIGSGFSAK